MAKTAPQRDEFPLLTRLDDLVAELHEHVPAALERFDADAVHAARVATRRLSAALGLMWPVLSKRHRKPLADGLRKLRKTLGPLRDADVLLDHLADVRRHAGLRPAADRLHARLSARRAELHEATRADVSVKRELRRLEAWPLVRQEVAEAREAVDSLLAESLHLQVDAFAEQADRLAQDLAHGGRPPSRRGRRAAVVAAEDDADQGMRAVAARPPRQNPHDLRIAGKALRYTLEMADAEGRSPGKAVAKKFKRMQDLLGDWHDQVVLVDRTLEEVVSAELGHHEAATAEQVLALATSALRQSTRDLSGFAKLWAEQGEKIAVKILAAFPLTRPTAQHDEPTSGFKGAAASANAEGIDASIKVAAATVQLKDAEIDEESGADADDAGTQSITTTASGTDPGPSDSKGRADPRADRSKATPAA